MDKNEFSKLLSERVLILDGATGTELNKRGYLADVGTPEELNLKYPERIAEIHRDYFEAGSDIVFANTFGANRLKLKDYGLVDKLEEINVRGIAIARDVAKKYNGLVAGDIASLGSYLTPLGPITFDQAYEAYAEQAAILQKAGADLIVIETMAEIREVKAALLAVKDNFKGPVLAQMTFTEDGAAVTGTDLLSFIVLAESMGADAAGMNCSVGPEEMARMLRKVTKFAHIPLSFKPNAGMPRLVDRQTVFPGKAEDFIHASVDAYNSGAKLLGGCCGTTPGFIAALAAKLKGRAPIVLKKHDAFFLSSRTKAVNIVKPEKLLVIGERINPTNRKKFQEELLAGNFATLRREAKAQVESGADILDINLGLPGADEKKLMERAVEEIQETVAVPLCLDSSSTEVLEAGLKACAGKPIINSVNGDDAKLAAILPLARRYGAAVIGLATDERGIPKTAADRLAIAAKILAAAQAHGMKEKEIIIDYLTLAASAMPEGIPETLNAIRESKKRWPHVKTVLGVSNVSFGLPQRQVLNSAFLALAKEAGLDMAILNPHENWTTAEPAATDVLLGRDPGAKHYVQTHAPVPKKAETYPGTSLSPDERLYHAVIDGNREEIGGIVDAVLAAGKPPLEIGNGILLRALNDVGEKFNTKEYFLPQVIRSAEAAQAAFGKIKPLLTKEKGFAGNKIVLATVKGDVHDIGKNIVAAVLESHGWSVIDLGKNIEAKDIVAAAAREKAPLIGVSALMTTTMLEMEKVVQERDRLGSAAKIIVGGAPVTKRFAEEIHADGYAKDAVEAARIAKDLTK